jgi:PD-(D/E)XK nuclease superfamily
MTVSREVPVVPAPAIPSKWDTIPIHASDVASFLRCRRYWAWSSPSRLNLRRRVDIGGVNILLWYGSGIHYALEQYYNPFLKRDPIEAFRTWYEYQWEGGIVTEDWLERLYDNHPQPIPSSRKPYTLYKVRGLKEIHPDPDHEEFEYHRDLGIGMLEFYKEYAERNDDFIVIAAEAVFSIPLGFEAVDTREESPNYGKTLEVHARGKRDAIIYRPDTELFGILEHKTAASIEDEYFTKLEMDPQCSTYMWAAQEEARIFDFPYKHVHGVKYNVLCKKYPKPPSILSDGISPSINRQEESTTAELFAEYIKEAGLQLMYDNTPKWQAYYNYLVDLGDKQFIERRTVLRNQHQLRAHGEHLRAIAKEMLDPNLVVYPTPTSNWTCTKCQFRAPCLAADDGSDYVHMLSDGYEENKGR